MNERFFNACVHARSCMFAICSVFQFSCCSSSRDEPNVGSFKSLLSRSISQTVLSLVCVYQGFAATTLPLITLCSFNVFPLAGFTQKKMTVGRGGSLAVKSHLWLMKHGPNYLFLCVCVRVFRPTGWTGHGSRRGGLHHESAQRGPPHQPESAGRQQELPGSVWQQWVNDCDDSEVTFQPTLSFDNPQSFCQISLDVFLRGEGRVEGCKGGLVKNPISFMRHFTAVCLFVCLSTYSSRLWCVSESALNGFCHVHNNFSSL